MSPSVSGAMSRRSERLDVMRGVAIAAVIGVHSFQSAYQGEPNSGVTEASKLFVAASELRYGVELFFFLSGWLIFSLYRGTGRFSAPSYWARRIARIWPLWLVFTALSFIVPYLITSNALPLNAPVAPEGLSPLAAFVICALFLGWTVEGLLNVPRGGFSIQLEMGHYLAFSWLHRASARIFLMTILFGYATFFAADWIAARHSTGFIQAAADGWLRLGIFGSWPFFVAGGLCSMLARMVAASGRSTTARLLARRWDLLLLILVIALIAPLIPIPQGRTVEAAIVVVALLGVALLASVPRGASRTLRSLGHYSYFMYFVHFWIIAAASQAVITLVDLLPTTSGLTRLLLVWGILFAVATSGSWALGIPSWRFFESRWITMAKRVS